MGVKACGRTGVGGEAGKKGLLYRGWYDPSTLTAISCYVTVINLIRGLLVTTVSSYLQGVRVEGHPGGREGGGGEKLRHTARRGRVG